MKVAAGEKVALPGAADTGTPLIYASAPKMILYFAALAKGTGVDQPRNLAKSVSVE